MNVVRLYLESDMFLLIHLCPSVLFLLCLNHHRRSESIRAVQERRSGAGTVGYGPVLIIVFITVLITVLLIATITHRYYYSSLLLLRRPILLRT